MAEMSSFKRIISLALSLSMLSPALIACSGGQGDIVDSTTAASTGSITTAQTTTGTTGGEDPTPVEFTPGSIPGIKLLFDATQLELENNDKVSEWKNGASEQFNAVSTDSRSDPVYVAESELGGKCGVRFGTSDRLRVEGSEELNMSDITLIAVIRAESISGAGDSNQIFSKLGVTSPYNHNWYFNINQSSYFNFGWKDSAGSYHDCNDSACALKSKTDYILGGVKSGNNGYLYINGENAGTMLSGVSGTATNTEAIYIGSSDKLGASLNGTICEIIMYDRALTNTELFNLHNYLSKKWGVSINTESFIPEDTELKISVDGKEIRELSLAQTAYKYTLAHGESTVPQISAECTLNGKKLDISIKQADSVSGSASVTINEYDAVYTVKFSTLDSDFKALKAPALTDVKLTDGSRWDELLRLYSSETVGYAIDRLVAQGAISNFKSVIRGSGAPLSNPWEDGLFYETITGASDLLALYPDKALKSKLDGYIDTIYDASMTSKNGYLSTHTMLSTPGKYFDETGNARWYHDCYNFGCLAEAGVRYYLATGEIKLLYTAVRFAEFIADNYGYGTKADGSTKINMVPSHSLPEETLLQLYMLLRDEDGLRERLESYSDKYPLSINEEDYAELVRFWVENRGNLEGRIGSYGKYAQDDMYYFEQEIAEGHAVRANLYYTGLASAGYEFANYTYLQTAKTLWNDIYEKQMYINGSTGSTSNDEAYGGDYELPNDGYCETCASAALAFFTGYMSLNFENSVYADTIENIYYNAILGGIGLDGKSFYYIQPLNSLSNARWSWHDCPCCVPMFLKAMSRLPSYIYAYSDNAVYVNQFISSTATLANGITVKQLSEMPWLGNNSFEITGGDTTLFIRIPSYADTIKLTVNGAEKAYTERNGYAVISVKSGDKVGYTIGMSVHRVYANSNVKADAGRVSLFYGPVLYCVEGVDNSSFQGITSNENALRLPKDSTLTVSFNDNLLGGIPVITFNGMDVSGNLKSAAAVPFYARLNRGTTSAFVWLKES